MIQDWNIKPRSRACHACARNFRDRDLYYTRLIFGAEGYARADFCDICWQEEKTKQSGYSAWKGIFKAPPLEPLKVVRKETAESLLRSLIAQDDRTKTNVIYILAVMLERQRVLVEREVRPLDEGGRRVVYEHRKTGETFIILDPQIKLDQLESVQQEVAALLGAGTVESGSAEDNARPEDHAGAGS